MARISDCITRSQRSARFRLMGWILQNGKMNLA
jgi:hypothetical protein